MKKLGLLGLVAILTMLLAPAVVQAGHLSCGDTLTADTTLDADLTCTTTSGLIIGADDITVDLNGHTITGAACAFCHGIRNGDINFTANPSPTPGFDGVKIEGPGTIVGFEQGIRGDTVSDFKIENVTLTGQLSSSAIDILDSEDVVIEDVTIVIPVAAGPAVEGIRLQSVDGVRVENVSITGGSVGVNFGCAPCPDPLGPTNGVIEDSTFTSNGNGIIIFDSTGAKVENNVITGSTFTGLIVGLGFLPVFGPVTNVKVSGNTVTGSGGSGILLGGASASKVSGNTVTGSGGDGIILIASAGNKVSGNTATGNTGTDLVDTSCPTPANTWKGNTFGSAACAAIS